MVEPTWYPIALPRTEKRITRARSRAQSHTAHLNWLLEAAPFAVAALWIVATLAATLLAALTGWRAPLAICRSEFVLTAAGALTVLAIVAGSAQRWMKR